MPEPERLSERQLEQVSIACLEALRARIALDGERASMRPEDHAETPDPRAMGVMMESMGASPRDKFRPLLNALVSAGEDENLTAGLGLFLWNVAVQAVTFAGVEDATELCERIALDCENSLESKLVGAAFFTSLAGRQDRRLRRRILAGIQSEEKLRAAWAAAELNADRSMEEEVILRELGTLPENTPEEVRSAKDNLTADQRTYLSRLATGLVAAGDSAFLRDGLDGDSSLFEEGRHDSDAHEALQSLFDEVEVQDSSDFSRSTKFLDLALETVRLGQPGETPLDETPLALDELFEKYSPPFLASVAEFHLASLRLDVANSGNPYAMLFLASAVVDRVRGTEDPESVAFLTVNPLIESRDARVLDEIVRLIRTNSNFRSAAASVYTYPDQSEFDAAIVRAFDVDETK